MMTGNDAMTSMDRYDHDDDENDDVGGDGDDFAGGVKRPCVSVPCTELLGGLLVVALWSFHVFPRSALRPSKAVPPR